MPKTREAMSKSQDTISKNINASIKFLEIQIGQLSRQFASHTCEVFNGNMVESHKNDSCNVIDLRDIVFSAVRYLRNEKKDRVEKEVYEE